MSRIIGGVVIILLSGVTTFLGFYLKLEYEKVEAYPSARGRVLTAGIGSARKSEERGTRTVYFPEVRYRYEVDGRTYENDTFGVMEPEWSLGRARETVRRYEAGKPCTVFYDPADPSESVLDKTSGKAFPWVIIVSGALFGLVGLAIAAGPLLRAGLLAAAYAKDRSRQAERTEESRAAIARRRRREEGESPRAAGGTGEGEPDGEADEDDGGEASGTPPAFPMIKTCEECGRRFRIRTPGAYKCSCGSGFRV
jgi:hypothetical protein